MRKNRRRYLLFQLHREGPSFQERMLNQALWKSLLSLYGEIHAADSRLYLVFYDCESGVGVLQCNLFALQEVITAAVMIGAIEGTSVSFEPKRTSGTIKGLRYPIPKRVS
ncbi:MAG: Rpp14/Pop5 family protein [Candidatus Thorarchaeota archaeon]|nr:Rpp14/Pop5 family protein [Candidatus Thorarchaeota archaeon]